MFTRAQRREKRRAYWAAIQGLDRLESGAAAMRRFLDDNQSAVEELGSAKSAERIRKALDRHSRSLAAIREAVGEFNHISEE